MNRARVAALFRELAVEFDTPDAAPSSAELRVAALFVALAGEFRTKKPSRVRAEAPPVEVDEVTRARVRRVLKQKGYRDGE